VCVCVCVCDIIGEGMFGKVYTAVNMDTGTYMAMKEVRGDDCDNFYPSCMIYQYVMVLCLSVSLSISRKMVLCQNG